MPPPLRELGTVARLSDETLAQKVGASGSRIPLGVALYGLLRREQAMFASGESRPRSEVSRILDFAQAAYGDLVAVLVGRDDSVLDTARDGEWSLRDLLRHAIVVELRYAAQVEWAATRGDDDPLAIPAGRLPGDRLAPPDPQFAASRTGGIDAVLELLEVARVDAS